MKDRGKRAEFEHRAGDPPHRLTRTCRLMAKDAASNRRIRAAVMKEFPPAPGSPAALAAQLRELGNRLKQERLRAGLSLADLAKRTGIDKAYLSRLENSQQANTTLETLRRVAAALGKELVVSLNDAKARAS